MFFLFYGHTEANSDRNKFNFNLIQCKYSNILYKNAQVTQHENWVKLQTIFLFLLNFNLSVVWILFENQRSLHILQKQATRNW